MWIPDQALSPRSRARCLSLVSEASPVLLCGSSARSSVRLPDSLAPRALGFGARSAADAPCVELGPILTSGLRRCAAYTIPCTTGQSGISCIARHCTKNGVKLANLALLRSPFGTLMSAGTQACQSICHDHQSTLCRLPQMASKGLAESCSADCFRSAIVSGPAPSSRSMQTSEQPPYRPMSSTLTPDTCVTQPPLRMHSGSM
jgi:hypothetical protein